MEKLDLKNRAMHPGWFKGAAFRSLTIIALLGFLSGAALAQGTDRDNESAGEAGPVVSAPVYPHVIDVDLRDLPIRSTWQPGEPVKEIPRRHNSLPVKGEKPAAARDPLMDLQNNTVNRNVSRAFSTPDVNVAGQGYSGVNPPDTVGDVGMNYYIQSINGSGGATYVIHNKSDGSIAAGPFSMESLGAGSCASGLGDPIILYDQLADRWMISEFASGANVLCVYISRTSDPISGGWYNYVFNTPNFPDYPKYGVWPDGYYVGTNENAPRMYALDRNSMLAGDPATSQRFDGSSLSGFGFQIITPADHDGATAPPAGSPAIFMRHKDDEVHGGSTASDYLEIFEFTVDWNNSSNSGISGPISIPISDFDSSLCGLTSFNCFPQPGTSTTLDPLREVVMNRLQYRNFGTHETLVGNFVTDVNGNDRGGIRWFELRKTSGSWSLYQEGTFSPDSDNRFMGGISMDGNGNIALAYNVTSSSTYPSLRYAGRLASDPLGTLPQGEYTLVNGSGSNGSNRYGDYAAMSVDPANDCTFWFTGQYNTSSSWSTRVGAFSFTCVTCTPPSAPTGLTAASSGNNNINLNWNAVSGASYNVYRATGGCPQGSYSLIASDVSGTSYSDSSVSGGVTYAYVVTAFDSCESAQSNCASDTAVGTCATPPTFDGIAAVTDLQQSACALGLSWNAGSANCGTGVSYNVYRSTTSGFTPGPANLIASCIGGTSYTDTDVSSGSTYYYVVRAEDNTGDGSGPCASGNEDSNTVELSGSPNGPQTTWFSDDLESGSSQWSFLALSADSGTSAWSVVSTDSASGSFSLFASDEGAVKDQVAAMASTVNLPAGASGSLTFQSHYNTESTYDGCVLEYSTNGSTWYDILAGNGSGVPANSGRITQNGYNATISSSYSSPIGGRQAWSGNSGGFLAVTVDLADFAGTSVSFRFRMACDTSVAGTGWWVDDVVVSASSDCGGTTCNYSISPTSDSYSAAGGGSTVLVTADTGCSWTAVSNNAWISITSGGSGSGDGTVAYSVAANTAFTTRTGTMTIAGQTFTVDQDAANQPPTVSITAPANGSTSNSGDSVTFSGSATDAEDGNISASLSWSSSLDGSIGSGASFSTSALSVGTHTITASVSDSGGESASDSISVTVNSVNPPPVADFTFSTSDLTVTFTDASTDDGTITGWAWDFGDSNGSSTANPVHTYAAAGTYTVSLTVTDNGGATDSVSKNVTVTAGGTPVINNGQTISGLSAATGEWIYYKIIVPADAVNLDISISGGTGDADLYVRFGAQPTESNYDCRPYAGGNNENCPFASPNQGEYYIGIRAYSAFSGLSLTASYSTNNGTGFTETNLSGATGSWNDFQITVPAGQSQLVIDISGGSGDADLYVRLGSNPDQSNWDYRPYLNGNNETVTINSPTAGTYYIRLRGYSAYSGVTLNAYYYP